jgi:hypothetical protein
VHRVVEAHEIADMQPPRNAPRSSREPRQRDRGIEGG